MFEYISIVAYSASFSNCPTSVSRLSYVEKCPPSYLFQARNLIQPRSNLDEYNPFVLLSLLQILSNSDNMWHCTLCIYTSFNIFSLCQN